MLQGFNKTTGAADVNNNSQADPYLVILTTAGGVVSSNNTADFGYTAPAAGYSISGTVFNDVNNNGVDNSREPPIPGTTVYLYRQLPDGSLVLIGTTVANGIGDYLFTDLPPGNYVVSTDALSTTANGFFQTTQTGASNPVQPVTITNANVIDQDFGYYRPPVAALSASLDYFKAEVQGRNVLLTWATLNEVDLLGFNLYRAQSQNGPWTKLNATIIAAQNPGSTQGNVYQWTDPNLADGQYWYRLDWVESTGSATGRHGSGPDWRRHAQDVDADGCQVIVCSIQTHIRKTPGRKAWRFLLSGIRRHRFGQAFSSYQGRGIDKIDVYRHVWNSIGESFAQIGRA